MKKSIFLFFAAILCATNAWGAKLFFDYSSVNYPADGALVAIWSWGGSSSDAWSVFKASGATNKIVADIANGRTGGKIVRFNSSVTTPDWGANQWNSTGDISFPSDKNCIKITSWDGATSGTWSKFQLESQASITPSASSVSVGEEVTFTPALTSNQEYNDVLSTTYSVDAGATITDGKFVATEAGTYTVTATVTYNAQGYTNITKTATATCSITVSAVAVPHPVTGVTIAPTSVTIKQGATTTLTATVSPSNADNPSITWSSDNTSVATVVNGVVTAVAAGTANITVTTVDGGFTATCAVKVKPLQYTFYAINSAEWPTVAAHYWGGADGGSSWPGADMVKESETVNGCDIYSITISSDFINIMFTNQVDGAENKKTADLTTEGNDGKYYDIKDAKWYASLSEVPVSYDYYITGSFNSNNPKNAENGMTFDGEVYKATVTLAEGDNTLKVTDGTWDKTWGANELGAAYEEVSNPNDYNNIKITLAAEAEKNITVIFNATAGKITFEGLTPYVAPLTYTVTVPEGTEKCFIAGNMNGWAFQEMEAVTGETNKFTITIVGAKETDEYKYACQADWAYAEVIDGGGNRTQWTALDNVTAWNKPAIVTYQLKGVGGWEQPGIELVQNPGNDKEYMLTCQAISATDAIKVVRLEDGVIKDYYGNGTVKDGVEVTVNYDDDGNITLAEGTYNFYFDTNEAEKKLWIAAATGCPVTVTVEDEFGTNTYTGVEENEGVWSKEYNVGDEVTLNIASLDPELVFAYWSVGAEKIFTEEYTFTVTEDVTVTAVYALPMEVTFDNMALDTESWIVEAGPDAEYGVTVTLGIDVEGDHPKGFGLVDGSQIYLGEDQLELVTGYFTAVDQDAPSAEAVIIAVYAGDLMAFVCTMSGAATPAVPVVVLDGVATPNDATGELWITGQWEGDDVYVQVPGFNGASFDCPEIWFYVGGTDFETASIIARGPATITVEDGDVSVEGTVTSGATSTDYELFVIATLPATTPDYTRTTNAGNFGTICLPFGGTVEGAELFECVGQETGKVYIASVTTLEAGVPYIFLATGTELAVYSDGTTALTPGNHKGLHGTFDDNTVVEVGNYILKDNALCQAATTCYVNANRAYLVMSEVSEGAPQQMPGRKYIGMSTKGENEATGFENITAPEGQTIKAIVNGQLIIIRNGEKFNAQGVRF